MASLKAEKPQQPAGQAKKEPKASGCCGNAPKATKQATNKAEQKPRETKKKKGLVGVMLARPIQVESCIRGPERRLLGFLGLRVEGKASGWFHRAAITSRSRRWMDNGSSPDWPNNACEAPHNWTATFLANFSIIASTLP
ncbi:hypothetical protein WN944_019907 [Citrus x changshan-huyou]|uniref:Uncharacterized protein n=1 Tax=Citrus x changshan-huyou TaxID=2935761 RepID=A0AAP0M2H3_9ROSI